MTDAHSVYRLGDRVFVVVVRSAPTALPRLAVFKAEVFRLGDDHRMAQVVLRDGSTLSSVAPTAWQAALRLVSSLETYVGGRAEEMRGYDASRYHADGSTWSVPR